MSSVWKIGTTLQTYAEAATFASLGLCNLRRTLIASGLDEVSFEAPAALALTADQAFAYGSTYVIWKDGTRWFYGRVTSIPRQGSAESESAQITLAGPFWYLQNATYMQSWNVYDSVGAELVGVNKCHVILFQNAAGARIDSGAQAVDVIDWLIARGAPILKGTIDTGIELPFDERNNLTCAEVLDTIIRWTPDWVAWFDYSTTTPTFHFRKRSSLTAASWALGGSSLQITPRYDLQKPGISITYEKTNTVDDNCYNVVEVDTAGDTAAIDCVHGVFDLQGSTITFVKQKIVTEAYPDPEEAADLKAWWKSKVSWLNGVADADLTIHDHSVDVNIQDYTRILKAGSVQEWMSKDAVQGCIRAKADYIIRDLDDNEVERVVDGDIVIQVTATDATTTTYSRLTSFDSGEATPTGVAAALFAAWSTLHFEGAFTIVEDECAGTYLPGKTLNITSGRTEWASMAAMIQEATEDVDNGTTSVQFGPPGRLEADSIIALFRALRARRFAWQATARTSGSSVGQGDIELSGETSDSSQSSGGGRNERLLVADTNAAGDHQVDLDPAGITHADAGDNASRVLAPREILVPEINGSSQLVFKLRQVLCSESYHAEQPLSDFVPASADHSWRFVQTSGTGGTLTLGQVFFAGVEKTVANFPSPATLAGVTTSTKYWIAIELAAGTFTWASGASYPTSDGDTEIWPILDITCAGSVITAYNQRYSDDIHITMTP